MFEKWADKLKEKTREQEEISFKSFDETTAAPKAIPEEPKAIKSTAGGKDSNIELKVVHPESFAEHHGRRDHSQRLGQRQGRFDLQNVL